MDQIISPVAPMSEAPVVTALPSSKLLFKEVMQTYKLLWKKLFLIGIIPGIFSAIFFYGSKLLGEEYFSNTPVVVAWLIVFLPIIIGGLVIWISQVASLVVISNAHKNIPDTVSSAIKTAFSNMWSFLFIIILTTLIGMGGILLFIIPGIVLSVYVSYGLVVLIDEKEKGYGAIIKSYLVVKGKFGQVVGALIKVGFRSLIYVIPLFVLALGAIFLGNYLDYGSFAPTSPVIQNGVATGLMFQGPYATAISQILDILTSALITPFFFILSYRIYAYLRFMKGAITPEEAQKAGKTLKIFTGLGVVAFVAFSAFFWYGFSTGFSQ